MEKPLSRIGSEKKELNKIRIYLREKCLAQMYSVRHFSCYFICIYFVVDDYIDLGQYKWILLQNTKEIGTFNRDVITVFV